MEINTARQIKASVDWRTNTGFKNYFRLFDPAL
jgi:hypothetical protein